MTRFFVNQKELRQSMILLTGENAAHAKVLRLKAGEEVLVCDGQGMECLCKVEGQQGNEYVKLLLEQVESDLRKAKK